MAQGKPLQINRNLINYAVKLEFHRFSSLATVGFGIKTRDLPQERPCRMKNLRTHFVDLTAVVKLQPFT